jgi:hypothetical protein
MRMSFMPREFVTKGESTASRAAATAKKRAGIA